MQNKDKGDGIEDSPLDMLLVILLEGASKEVVVVTPSSSSPSWREFDNKFLNPTSKGEKSQTLNDLLMLELEGKSNS